MDLRAIFIGSASLCLLALACSSSTSVAPPAAIDAGGADAATNGLSVEDFCMQDATKLCTSLAMCAPTLFASGYGDAATCVADQTKTCAPFAPFGTDASRRACLDSDDLSTCEALGASSRGAITPECIFMGPGADGTPCFNGGQCQSGSCAIANGLRCGTCTAPATTGGACPGAGGCEAPLACVLAATGGSCHHIGRTGDTCNSSTLPCATGLSCTNGTCAAAIPLGGTCTDSASCGFENVCNATTSKCEALATAALGEACGFQPSGSLKYCTTGSCRSTDGAYATGTCMARIPVGQSCAGSLDIYDGPCEGAAQCIHGTCAIPDTTTCTAAVVPSTKATTCSGNGATATKLLFKNNTADRDLTIYWVDTTCTENFYVHLAPGASWNEDTYVTHAWRVRDMDTNELVKEAVGQMAASEVDIP